LLGYSFIDLIVSLIYASSSLPVPKGTPGTFGAMGNWTTCQVTGFFLQFNASLGVYWAFICFYYVAMVRYRVPEKSIVKYEICVHGLAYLLPLSLGIAMVILKMYNPTNINAGHCFVNCYPANCLRDENVQCERRANYSIWSLINMIPAILASLVVIVSSILTCRAVKRTQLRQSRWNFSSSMLIPPTASADQSTELQPNNTSPNNAPNRSFRRSMSLQMMNWTSSMRLSGINNNQNGGEVSNMAETTRQVRIQTILYIASYATSAIPFSVMQLSTLFLDGVEENRTYYFFWVVLLKLTLSTTGTWNFLIYCRPRMISLRKRNPDASSLSLLRHLIWNSKLAESTTPILSPLRRTPSAPISYNVARSNSSQISINDWNREKDFTPELELADNDSQDEKQSDLETSSLQRSANDLEDISERIDSERS
jgi:hypothetical protein